MLDDGTYDAFVVWAEPVPGGPGDTFSVEVTITAGPHKGEMVTLALRTGADPTGLIGLPGRLVVEDGRPRLEL